MKIPTTENAVILMWATNPKLKEAIELLESWGFEYKTNMVWIKDKFGTGWWVRGQHELLLLGTKGKVKTPANHLRPSSVISAKRTKHSKKPEMYEIIEKIFPRQKYLELFARNKRKGWESWGNDSAVTSR
jgi:N6-adenosine-specific RNA methylase IME4